MNKFLSMVHSTPYSMVFTIIFSILASLLLVHKYKTTEEFAAAFFTKFENLRICISLFFLMLSMILIAYAWTDYALSRDYKYTINYIPEGRDDTVLMCMQRVNEFKFNEDGTVTFFLPFEKKYITVHFLTIEQIFPYRQLTVNDFLKMKNKTKGY